MKISVFILIGFIMVLSLFTLTTYINFQLSEQVTENTAYLSLSTQIVKDGNRFQRNILNMVSGMHGYLFSGEDYFIQAYDSAARENEDILQELSTLVGSNPLQDSILSEIAKRNKLWIASYAKPLMEAKRSSIEHTEKQQEFNDISRTSLQNRRESRTTNEIISLIKSFINNEYLLREKRKEALERSINVTRTASILLTTFSILAGFLIAAFVAHRISKRILKMVSMANSIASGDYQVHKDESKDELSKLAHSLNNMSLVLSENISLLKQKNSELNQFAHIVSHDLKAPLRGIDNVVKWIEEDHFDELNPKVKEYLGLIKTRIIRGENLINGILSYSQAAQYSVAKEPVDLSQLLQDISEGFAVAKLKLSLPDYLPTIETEKVPLTQLFSNLLSNSIKYTEKEEVLVTIDCKEYKDHYAFSVTDNGPGIPVQYHEKIFKMFQTLNGNSFENTGIGLAIVKKILDDRKQKIEVHSEKDKGTTFSFTWPK